MFAQIYILEFVLTSKDNQMRQIMHSGNGQNEHAKYSMSSQILSNYTKQIVNFYKLINSELFYFNFFLINSLDYPKTIEYLVKSRYIICTW